MNNKNQAALSSHQLTTILIGSMLALNILSLPSQIVPISKQDSWISAALGNVYPIYLLIICLIIAKKYPQHNILKLSQMCFGKALGNIFNFIFLTYFILNETILASALSNVLRVYISFFMENIKILITVFLVPAFIAYKGLKPIGRMSEIIFYTTLPAFLIPLASIKDRTILNIMPVFGAGAMNIINSMKITITAYSGIEVLFVLYPFLNNKNKLKSCGIFSILFTTVMYTWFTFITIYYLGIALTPKFLWPCITACESINVPLINSFRFISLALWFFMALRTLSIFYYVVSYGLSEIFTKVNIQYFIYLLYPIFFGISMLYGPSAFSRSIFNKVSIPYIIFNIMYVTTIAIFLKMKVGNKNVS